MLRWVDEERGSNNRLHLQLYWALLFAVPTVFVAPYLWMKYRFHPYSEQIQLCQFDVRNEGTRDTPRLVVEKRSCVIITAYVLSRLALKSWSGPFASVY